MLNATNEVVGIWYVGYSANLEVVKNVIASSRLLEEGLVGLLNDRGNLRMHSDNISQSDIEQTEQAEQVATAMHEMSATAIAVAESASLIRDTNFEMASTAEEQRQVSEDISERLDATRQIALTSQNNVVETNSAAESLGVLARNLEDRLNHYKT